MTIAVRISNTNGAAPDGGDRYARVSYLPSALDETRQPMPEPVDLGPGEECTVHIHGSVAVVIEEYGGPQPFPQGDNLAEPAEAE